MDASQLLAAGIKFVIQATHPNGSTVSLDMADDEVKQFVNRFISIALSELLFRSSSGHKPDGEL